MSFSFDFSQIQTRLSSAYETVSSFASEAFATAQQRLPGLNAADLRTMAFGAAFFGSLLANPILTTVSGALGAFYGEGACDLGNRAIALFNEQTIQVKVGIVAATIVSIIALRLVGLLTNNVLKPIAISAVGFYTGLVWGAPRV